MLSYKIPYSISSRNLSSAPFPANFDGEKLHYVPRVINYEDPKSTSYWQYSTSMPSMPSIVFSYEDKTDTLSLKNERQQKFVSSYHLTVTLLSSPVLLVTQVARPSLLVFSEEKCDEAENQGRSVWFLFLDTQDLNNEIELPKK